MQLNNRFIVKPAVVGVVPSITQQIINGVSTNVISIPVAAGKTLEFAASSATRVTKSCEAVCRGKKLQVQFKVLAAACSGCNPSFNFRLSRAVPADRREDILALDSYNTTIEYDATGFISRLATPASVTISQILDDAIIFFNTTLVGLQGASEYTITKFSSDTLEFSCVSPYCFDFDVWENHDSQGCIVSKTVIEPFADDELSTEWFKQMNDAMILNVVPGQELPPLYPLTNKVCIYNFYGCQALTDSSGLFSRNENSGTPGYLAGSIPYDIDLWIEQDASAAAYETGLATALAKTVEIDTKCNVSTVDIATRFGIAIATNTLTLTYTGATVNGVVYGAATIFGNAQVFKGATGTAGTVNNAAGGITVVKIGAANVGTYQYQVAGTPTNWPTGQTYTIKFDITLTVTIGGVARACIQTVTKSVTI